MNGRIWDISEPVSERTAVFPGDVPFGLEWTFAIERGDSVNVAAIRTTPHCGAHADAPLHVRKDGSDIASVELWRYVGRCRVLDAPVAGAPPVVDAAALGEEALAGAERVLLRTRNDHDAERFDPGFAAVGEDAARRLIEAGVVLVGIDTPSVDPADSRELPTHHLLLDAGLAWLENLDLSAVPAGDYELIALPLRLIGCDASPVRAILRELPQARPSS